MQQQLWTAALTLRPTCHAAAPQSSCPLLRESQPRDQIAALRSESPLFSRCNISEIFGLAYVLPLLRSVPGQSSLHHQQACQASPSFLKISKWCNPRRRTMSSAYHSSCFLLCLPELLWHSPASISWLSLAMAFNSTSGFGTRRTACPRPALTNAGCCYIFSFCRPCPPHRCR